MGAASRGFAVVILLQAAEALMPGAIQQQSAVLSSRTGSVQMAGAAALAKKTVVVEKVRENMDDAQLMFRIRSEGIQPNQLNLFRQSLPEDIKLQCVKNTLVKVASRPDDSHAGYERFNPADTAAVDEMLQYSNYWFFVPEERMRESVKIFDDWVNDNKLKDKDGEARAIIGGFFDGQVLDSKGVVAVSKLPTKQELMQQTAVSLKLVPTKLARSLKAAGAERLAKGLKQASAQKLSVAVKLASEKMD